MTPFTLTPNFQPISLFPHVIIINVLDYPYVNEIGFVFGFSENQAGIFQYS